MAPKDEKIINKDDSVTNNESNSDLEKGEQENVQKKPDEERVPTVTPDNENGDPGPPEEKPAVDKGETQGADAEL
jgi:hypothetical protein